MPKENEITNLRTLNREELEGLGNKNLSIKISVAPHQKPAASILPENWDKIRIKNKWGFIEDVNSLTHKIFSRFEQLEHSNASGTNFNFSLEFPPEFLAKLKEIAKQ